MSLYITSRSRLMAMASSLALTAAVSGGPASAQDAQPIHLEPSTMPKLGMVDERFQSYNVEMVEVTGGRFWAPYSPETFAALENPEAAAAAATPEEIAATPSGMNPALYEYRPPIDLGNERLRKLAAALGPAYMRVSGTWANTTCSPTARRRPRSRPKATARS